MKLFTATLVLLLVGAVVGDIAFEVDLKPHLEKVFSQRYPIERYNNNRQTLKQYIKEKLISYGLRVQEQKFNTTVNEDPNDRNSKQIVVEGTNIIGVVEAVTKAPGAVVVVGADYDSNGITDPVFRNGAGVAALLEVAHLYGFNQAWSGRFVKNYTTVFVAFDINTKLHSYSPGEPGTSFFVREWLWPYINQQSNYFGGAVIFDSIMNVNYNRDTQQTTRSFEANFPDTFSRLEEDLYKGNFLAMVSKTGSEAATTLKDQFKGSYNKERKARPFRLEDMAIRSTSNPGDGMIQTFTETDAIHFWSFNKDNTTTTPIHLPAILLTDTTTSFRDDPTAVCRPLECTGKDIITEARMEFVEATVKATVDFLLKRQATLLPESNSATSALPSLIATAVTFLLVKLFK